MADGEKVDFDGVADDPKIAENSPKIAPPLQPHHLK